MQRINYEGQILDNRYRVEKLLGEGGMGAVYGGSHLIIGRQVAIKFLHAEFTGKKEVIKRFYREAQTAASIRHKNIIEIFDVGVAESGEPYMVMEYLEGESMSSMLKRTGPMDLGAVCGVMEPALLALQAAHEQGIVHRDLKPDNIFIAQEPGGEPVVKLIDFGISKLTNVNSQSHLTQTGYMLGTPAYMSPEQALASKEVDHRADIYAMGVILYEMLTGKMPFEGETYNQLLLNVMNAMPRPPRVVNASFPEEAEPLVMSCLAKKPEQRPQNATETLTALKKLSAFDSRAERFSKFASSITKRSFAGGDLGDTLADSESDSKLASDMLASIVGNTPTNWAATTSRDMRQKKRSRLIATMVTVIVVLVGVAGFLLFNRGDEPDSVVAPLAQPVPVSETQSEVSAAPTEKGVEIGLKGVPEGAKIFYNRVPVPKNPFRVDRKETISSVEVRAEGFETFVTSCVPSEDLSLQVKMKPVAAKPKAKPRTTRRTSRTVKKKPSPEKTVEQTPPPPPPKPAVTIKEVPQKKPETKKQVKIEEEKFQSGRRGTKFGSSFE